MSATWTNCSSKEKVKLFRRHAMDTVLARCGIPPSLFHKWQKVSSKHKTCGWSEKGGPVRQLERRIMALEARVSQKSEELSKAIEVLAEVMEEHIRVQERPGNGREDRRCQTAAL